MLRFSHLGKLNDHDHFQEIVQLRPQLILIYMFLFCAVQKHRELRSVAYFNQNNCFFFLKIPLTKTRSY